MPSLGTIPLGGNLVNFNSSGLLDDPAALRDRFSRDSFLLFRRLIEPSLIQSLRVAILDRLADVGWLERLYDVDEPCPTAPPHHDRGVLDGKPVVDPEWRQGYKAVQSLEQFHALAYHPELMRALTCLFGEEPVVHPRKIARIGFPGITFPTPPHQDALFNESATDVVTAWIPIGSCRAVSGALRVLRGSAAEGVLEVRRDNGLGGESVDVSPAAQWVEGDYAAGDVIIFHSRTVHMTPPNQTGFLRLSMDARYQLAGDPFKAAALLPHGYAAGQLPSWRRLTEGWSSRKWVEVSQPIRVLAVPPEQLPPSRLVPEPQATGTASCR